MKTKVFGIGFHKTGTTTLDRALTELGYRVTGPNWVDDINFGIRNHDRLIRRVKRYDAVQDSPWPLLYRELDQAFPGSKFILTIRDPESWIRSVVNHFGTYDVPINRWIYGVGSPVGNEDLYIERMQRHNREVVKYFKGGSEDFMVWDISYDPDWERLCTFLGADIPDAPFPHANKGSNLNSGMRQVILRLRLLRRFFYWLTGISSWRTILSRNEQKKPRLERVT